MAEKQYEPQKKIEPIEGLDASRQVQLDKNVDISSEVDAATKVKFDEALQKADPSRVAALRQEQVQPVASSTADTKKPSLIELAKTTHESMSAQPIATVNSVKEKATELRHSFERPRATLMSLEELPPMSPKTQAELNQHIEHADTALKDAASMTKGVETGSLVQQDKPPLMKFLNFLTDGDRRVTTMIDDISKLNLNAQKMSPQLLIAIQIKLGFVQQELEFFTNVLNKSLESTKTIMNVQI